MESVERRVLILWRCATAAAVSTAAALGLLVEGLERFSISVNHLSGRTEESALDWEKLFSLRGEVPTLWSGQFSTYSRCEPDARVEGGRGDGVHIGK